MASRSKGLTLTELIVVCVVVLLIATFAIPGLISSRRASNERNASASLKTLSSAQADFRANDRDGNGVNDFWTADVKSLYTMTSPKGPSVKLIDLGVAAADADPAFFPAGGLNVPIRAFAVPQARAGFWYAALTTDLSFKDPKEAAYRADTLGNPSMGAVHNPSKFGFVTFPDIASVGRHVFRVNENNTIFRETIRSQRPWSGSFPGLKSIPPHWLHWPDDDNLKKWFRCDCG